MKEPDNEKLKTKRKEELLFTSFAKSRNIIYRLIIDIKKFSKRKRKKKRSWIGQLFLKIMITKNAMARSKNVSYENIDRNIGNHKRKIKPIIIGFNGKTIASGSLFYIAILL